MRLRLSRGEAEGESETRELCRAPNPCTRYSRSNLYYPGMCGFECAATQGNKKCGLCLYLIHNFGPIACIKSDARWYKNYIYYKYSTHLRGISINIAPKLGIFPEAEVNIHYQGCNIIDIPQGRVEYLFYYIGQVYTTVQTYLNTKAASFWTHRHNWTYSSRANLQQYHPYRHITEY